MSKLKLLYVILVLLIVAAGVVVYKVVSPPQKMAPVVEEPAKELPPVESSVTAEVVRSRVKDNTVVMRIAGLSSKYASIAYELTYESQGLIKGVNSGSRPLEVGGKDSFEREIYLGTCSRNVCKPDLGVTRVSLALEFTDTGGRTSQFSKEFEL